MANPIFERRSLDEKACVLGLVDRFTDVAPVFWAGICPGPYRSHAPVDRVLGLKLAGRGYVLELGRIVLEDSARSLLADPEVQNAYLGGVG